MKYWSTKLVLAAAVLAAGASAIAALATPGEKAPYTFREPPVNSLGLKSMADLRGKPVLIDFWGTH